MSTINGLPAHVLLVHLLVVLVPLTALALVVGAVWPQAARRMGLVLPLLALVTLASVPLATEAGEWLEEHVTGNALIRRHTELGDGLLPWAVGLFVLAAVVWWTTRRTPAEGTAPRSATIVRIAALVLSVVVAAGAVVDVYRIGDSGAKAAWTGGFSKSPTDSGDGDD